MEQDKPNNFNASGFVGMVIQKLNKKKVNGKTDTAFRAVMRRGANPSGESVVWEYLIPYCNIGVDRIRHAFALVGAAIAAEAPETDGTASLGRALRSICKNDDDVERESRRLRRLLSCDTTDELVGVLRPMMHYIQDNATMRLSYKKLLNDLCYWSERTRIGWTQDFFLKSSTSEKDDGQS